MALDRLTYRHMSFPVGMAQVMRAQEQDAHT